MTSLLLLDSLYIWLIVVCVIVVVFAIILTFVPVGIWVRALVSGTYISGARLLGMKLRKIDVNLLVNCYINARKAGLKIKIDDLETHHLAGGNVERVVDALIAAHGAKIVLPAPVAKAIDLANRDVLEAVQTSVHPVVIETPMIAAVAMDGIEVRAKARVTVRTNVNKLVGGAGKDTIIARVGQGIVATIGSAKKHQAILENPGLISKNILEKGLDVGTAYDILSVDIVDVDIGRNIGAKLEADRAEADMQIAQARAEERRANAIAAEQEMRARTQEKRAQLLDAEAEVPKAISTAFRAGRIGVMDYYKIQNMVADTSMRNSLGGTSKSGAPIIREAKDKRETKE